MKWNRKQEKGDRVPEKANFEFSDSKDAKLINCDNCDES